MKVRRRERLVQAMPPPDMPEDMAKLVKRPTPEGYRRWSRLTHEERLRTAFRLIAFAQRLEASHAPR